MVVILWFRHVSRRQEASKTGGIREPSSQPGTDSWLDDPITRHIIGLQVSTPADSAPDNSPTPVTRDATSSPPPATSSPPLWPISLHTKGSFRILVLSSVDPRHLAAYLKLTWQEDCGGPSPAHLDSPAATTWSTLLTQLPTITG